MIRRLSRSTAPAASSKPAPDRRRLQAWPLARHAADAALVASRLGACASACHEADCLLERRPTTTGPVGRVAFGASGEDGTSGDQRGTSATAGRANADRVHAGCASGRGKRGPGDVGHDQADITQAYEASIDVAGASSSRTSCGPSSAPSSDSLRAVTACRSRAASRFPMDACAPNQRLSEPCRATALRRLADNNADALFALHARDAVATASLLGGSAASAGAEIATLPLDPAGRHAAPAAAAVGIT